MRNFWTTLREPSSHWELPQKIFYTIFLLILYRLGTQIAIPFVDGKVFQQALDMSAAGSAVLTALTFTGASLYSMGIFALGVMPYITASIIFQLFKVTFPRLHEMYNNPIERERITQWTRYLTIFLAATTSFTTLRFSSNIFGVDLLVSKSPIAFGIAWASMITGAIIVMRMGELITNKGFTNGMSLLIFTSILSNIPSLFAQSWVFGNWVSVLILSLLMMVVLMVIVFVERSETRVQVIYPKASTRQQVSRNFIPVKVSIAGVLPVIFVSTMITMPMILSSFFGWSWAEWLNRHFVYDSPLYLLTFLVLLVIFTYVAIPMNFDSGEIAKQIRNSGGFIPGKAAGEGTKTYLNSVANSMGILDVIYLAALSLVTLLLFPLVGLGNGAFGTTSLIILGTVVVTIRESVKAEQASTLKGVSLLRQ